PVNAQNQKPANNANGQQFINQANGQQGFGPQQGIGNQPNNPNAINNGQPNLRTSGTVIGPVNDPNRIGMNGGPIANGNFAGGNNQPQNNGLQQINGVGPNPNLNPNLRPI